MRAFLLAKLILILRDSESWYENLIETLWRISKETEAKGPLEVSSLKVFELTWDRIFSQRMTDEEKSLLLSSMRYTIRRLSRRLQK